MASISSSVALETEGVGGLLNANMADLVGGKKMTAKGVRVEMAEDGVVVKMCIRDSLYPENRQGQGSAGGDAEQALPCAGLSARRSAGVPAGRGSLKKVKRDRRCVAAPVPFLAE